MISLIQNTINQRQFLSSQNHTNLWLQNLVNKYIKKQTNFLDLKHPFPINIASLECVEKNIWILFIDSYIKMFWIGYRVSIQIHS